MKQGVSKWRHESKKQRKQIFPELSTDLSILMTAKEEKKCVNVLKHRHRMLYNGMLKSTTVGPGV